MRLGIITLFPRMFLSVTDYGVIRKSIQSGSLFLKFWNPRVYALNKNQKVDDRPYGGGPGMVIMAQPIKVAIAEAKNVLGHDVKVIYFSPQGKKLNQKYIRQLAHNNNDLIFICGRYQGMDERVIKTEIDEEWSIGDYILSGGELAAMILIDSVARLLPNVLGNSFSQKSDSFFRNRLEFPHYTRPKVFEGMKIPSILLSGNHKKISRWKLKQALGRTWMRRPDLLYIDKLTHEEKILLSEFKKEYLISLKRRN